MHAAARWLAGSFATGRGILLQSSDMTAMPLDFHACGRLDLQCWRKTEMRANVATHTPCGPLPCCILHRGHACCPHVDVNKSSANARGLCEGAVRLL